MTRTSTPRVPGVPIAGLSPFVATARTVVLLGDPTPDTLILTRLVYAPDSFAAGWRMLAVLQEDFPHISRYAWLIVVNPEPLPFTGDLPHDQVSRHHD